MTSTHSPRRAGRTAAVLLTSCALAGAAALPVFAAPTPGPNPSSNNNGKSGDSNAKTKPTPTPASGGTSSGGQSSGGAQSTGNAGTIKIAFPRADSDPDNDAKPGCTVRLDFYGFRTGTYNAEFNSIAPTASKQLATGNVTITQPRTPASRLQTSKRFTLDVSGLTPANQGYHVKVRVTNPANPGNGAKTKVFYFDCEPGNGTVFTGGGGGFLTFGAGSGSGNASNPRSGFATGAGGTAPSDLPLLPISGLLAGLGLMGAAAATRTRKP